MCILAKGREPYVGTTCTDVQEQKAPQFPGVIKEYHTLPIPIVPLNIKWMGLLSLICWRS